MNAKSQVRHVCANATTTLSMAFLLRPRLPVVTHRMPGRLSVTGRRHVYAPRAFVLPALLSGSSFNHRCPSRRLVSSCLHHGGYGCRSIVVRSVAARKSLNGASKLSCHATGVVVASHSRTVASDAAKFSSSSLRSRSSRSPASREGSVPPRRCTRRSRPVMPTVRPSDPRHSVSELL